MISSQISHRNVDELLKLLTRHGHSDLPSTTRTLLGTLKRVVIDRKSGVEYKHIGLRDGIVTQLSKYPAVVIDETNCIEISLNVDGMPLFKSSSMSLWPVLAQLHLEPLNPGFPVTLTYGKPKNLDFLEDTVSELKDVLACGICIIERTVNVILRAIICDAPARAFIKASKYFSGYGGCDRCDQPGHHIDRRHVYLDTDNLNLRTDQTFKGQTDPIHHHGISPFTHLGEHIDMVTQFPLDYMHVCCLGVTKRLLTTWTKGDRQFRQSARQQDELSERLIALRSSISRVFARQAR